MEHITVVLDNIRSAYNVGAIMRSCAAFGTKNLIAIGVTPYPKQPEDQRLPHVARNADKAISKSALGTQKLISVTYFATTNNYLRSLDGPLYALEQTKAAQPIQDFKPSLPCSIVLGNEVEGVSPELLDASDEHIIIPHLSVKNSLNVSVAAGVALSWMHNNT